MDGNQRYSVEPSASMLPSLTVCHVPQSILSLVVNLARLLGSTLTLPRPVQPSFKERPVYSSQSLIQEFQQNYIQQYAPDQSGIVSITSLTNLEA